MLQGNTVRATEQTNPEPLWYQDIVGNTASYDIMY